MLRSKQVRDVGTVKVERKGDTGILGDRQGRGSESETEEGALTTFGLNRKQ